MPIVLDSVGSETTKQGAASLAGPVADRWVERRNARIAANRLLLRRAGEVFTGITTAMARRCPLHSHADDMCADGLIKPVVNTDGMADLPRALEDLRAGTVGKMVLTAGRRRGI